MVTTNANAVGGIWFAITLVGGRACPSYGSTNPTTRRFCVTRCVDCYNLTAESAHSSYSNAFAPHSMVSQIEAGEFDEFKTVFLHLRMSVDDVVC